MCGAQFENGWKKSDPTACEHGWTFPLIPVVGSKDLKVLFSLKYIFCSGITLERDGSALTKYFLFLFFLLADQTHPSLGL